MNEKDVRHAGSGRSTQCIDKLWVIRRLSHQNQFLPSCRMQSPLVHAVELNDT